MSVHYSDYTVQYWCYETTALKRNPTEHNDPSMGCPLYNILLNNTILFFQERLSQSTCRGRVEIGGGRHFYDFFSTVHIFVLLTSPALDICTTDDPNMITYATGSDWTRGERDGEMERKYLNQTLYC
jgi:hypothetical protein